MRNMFVDPNRRWTSIYHLTVRHLILGLYPVILYCLFYFSIIGGATGLDWSKFDCISKSYYGLYIWYAHYWTYLEEEDILTKSIRLIDYFVAVCRLVISAFFGYFYYPIKQKFLEKFISVKFKLHLYITYIIFLPFGVGEFYLFIYLFFGGVLYIFFGFFWFLFNICKEIFFDVFSLVYLIIIEELYYNYLVAVAFYIFSNKQQSGGSIFLSLKRFFAILPRGLSIGAYGVHFQPSLENSLFGRVFRFLKRGPYMWKNEEQKLTTNRADHFVRVLFLRFLVIFYFFLPNGEEYRRRSVLWQLLLSDLPEDRYIDFTLTPGLRYTVPLYFFIYSNFFAIDFQEYSEIVFSQQQEELIRFLWGRKKYFNKLKQTFYFYLDYFFNKAYYLLIGVLNFCWYLFLFIYLFIYFIRSFIVILSNLVQIIILSFLSLLLYLVRLVLIFQINSILYCYRLSQSLAQFLLGIYELVAGIIFFVLLFTLLIAPSYFYIVQTLWGMGGIFLAYFYIIWIPLLLLAGIYEEWKLVLHELGEWLFVLCFHMGGWSVLCLRVELDPRFWFMETDFELNHYGPMAQEYQGFYFMYVGWFMDLFYVIYVA